MPPESEDYLVRYLLGDLPDDEAERLDERSITDDEFALRLRMLENDLVDRFVRGEPLGPGLERFDLAYRSSAHLRGKASFARALHKLAAASPEAAGERITSAPGWVRWWTIAAAAVLVVAAGYLGIRNLQLRDELAQLDLRRASAEQQARDLQQELERSRSGSAVQAPRATATFVLPAPRRGLGTDMTAVSLPLGTQEVYLRPQVETDAYPTLWGALREVSSGRVVWRSGDVPAEVRGGDSLATFAIPASVFVAGRYTLEVSGSRAGQPPELLGHYPLQVVLE